MRASEPFAVGAAGIRGRGEGRERGGGLDAEEEVDGGLLVGVCVLTVSEE